MATNTLVATVTVGLKPQGITVASGGKHAYVTNSSDGTVSVIDTSTNTVVGSPIPVGSLPIGIAITKDGTHAYVVNDGSNNVSVLATASKTTVAVGTSPFGVGIAP